MSSYHSTLSLPLPNDDQVAHSSRLIECIQQNIIEAGGVISFRDYMQSCLYEPGLGYYSAGSSKLGAEGDFVTAPEISPLFGYCMANALAESIASGTGARVLEFGAGSGKLCADIIYRFKQLDVDWLEYSILETSADFRQRQQQYLKQHLSSEQLSRVLWLDQLPNDFNGLVIGNEVLDAMPVNVVMKQSQWMEMGVGISNHRFDWMPYSTDSDAVHAINVIDDNLGLSEGYSTEVNLNYLPWFQALAAACQQAEILLIDYGFDQRQYYHSQRVHGTLSCFYQHRIHSDPFVYPGLQDITAYVDFDALADAAETAGFKTVSLQTQADFLLAYGLLELAVDSTEMTAQISHAQQVKTLTLPGEMGEKFKVARFTYNHE